MKPEGKEWCLRAIQAVEDLGVRLIVVIEINVDSKVRFDSVFYIARFLVRGIAERNVQLRCRWGNLNELTAWLDEIEMQADFLLDFLFCLVVSLAMSRINFSMILATGLILG